MTTDLTTDLVEVGEAWDRVRPDDPSNLKVGTITVEAVGPDWIVLRADHGRASFVRFEKMNRTEAKLKLDEFRRPARTQKEDA